MTILKAKTVFFLFLRCISYTYPVNIIPLYGTHGKKEPLVGKDSKFVVQMGICSFLYILNLSTFPLGLSDK